MYTRKKLELKTRTVVCCQVRKAGSSGTAGVPPAVVGTIDLVVENEVTNDAGGTPAVPES
jgi:hypothetical protein